MKRSLYTSLLALCIIGLMQAIPPQRVTFITQQSDGTTLEFRNNGDAFTNYFSTLDGYIILKDSNGDYFYTSINEHGEIARSNQLAHNPDERSIEELAFLDNNPSANILKLYKSYREKVTPQRASTRMGEMPITTGSPNIPIILIAFNDQDFKEEQPHEGFYKRLCRPATKQEIENKEGSAFQYFSDQSNGIFTPNFVVIGPVTLDKSYAYYGENDTYGLDFRAGEMIADAVRKAEAANMVNDWSIFDNNKDGVVDVTYVLYAGEGANVSSDPNMVWPHQSTLSSQGTESPIFDGITFEAYACNNELMFGEIDGFGTFCHEFSHCLGLPDFYPTLGTVDVFGMDYWSLMDFGSYKCDGYIPAGYTAYEKEFFGWQPMLELTTPSSITDLKPTNEGGTGLKIVNSKAANEYYILETIDGTGWNTGNYAQGLMITHVNYSESAWQNNTVNNNPKMPGITIIPADNDMTTLIRGNNDAEYENSLKGDLWPGPTGNTSLTDTSIPAALVHNGWDGYMKKPITNITYDAETRTASFDFMGGGDNPLSISTTMASDYTGSTIFRIDGTQVKEAKEKGIYLIRKKDGKTIKITIQ